MKSKVGCLKYSGILHNEMRKRLFGSLWDVWMIGIPRLMESRHEHGIIPFTL